MNCSISNGNFGSANKPIEQADNTPTTEWMQPNTMGLYSFTHMNGSALIAPVPILSTLISF